MESEDLTGATAVFQRRAAFGEAGGVVALIALMHASSPASPVGVNVADALRLLALDDEPTVHI